MPLPAAELQQLTDGLLLSYQRAWNQVVAEQTRVAQGMAQNPRLWRQRDRLAEARQRIEAEMAHVDKMANHWMSREYPKFYLAGANAAAESLHQPFSWTQTHRDAVILLVRDTYDDLLEATAFVREDTKRYLREVSREATIRGQLVGKTAKQTAGNITKFLERQGITSVVYKNGARHGLADYADMMVRTKTAVAYNVGTLNQGAEFGVKYYEVFDGPACGWTSHDDLELANGKIVSAKEAGSVVIAHPRCARSFGPRPDITTPVVAKGAKPTAGGQELPRPEAAQFPLEAAARTREARAAAAERRGAAGLVGRPRTPAAVLARRAAMLQKGPGAAARGESGLHPQSRRKAKEKPAEDFGPQLEGFDTYDEVLDRAWTNPGSTEAVAWDGGAIEDLQLRLTRVNLDGQERTLVQFKLREAQKKALEKRGFTGGQVDEVEMRRIGQEAADAVEARGGTAQEIVNARLDAQIAYRQAHQGEWDFGNDVTIWRMDSRTGAIDPGGEAAYTGNGVTFRNAQSWRDLPTDQPYVRFYTGEGERSSFAFDGLVQAFLPGRPTPAQLADFMRTLGVDHLGYPTPAHAGAYVRNRLGELFRVRRHGGPLGEEEVDQALAGARRVFGVDPAKARLAPGHGGRVEVHLDPDSVRAIMDKTGVHAFSHSLSVYDAEGIANILESGALKSTTVRWTEGIGRAGQSSTSDVRTGGADYVFTRQLRNAGDAYDYSPTFVLDGEDLLTRTDWFAYVNDSFGAQNPLDDSFAHAVAARDNLRNLGKGAEQRSNQETMFKQRVGFGAKDYLVLPRELRDDVLAVLKRRGVTHVGGQLVERFIRPRTHR